MFHIASFTDKQLIDKTGWIDYERDRVLEFHGHGESSVVMQS